MVPLIWRSASLTFPILLITFFYGWRRARVELVVFVLPAIGLVLFYAAASQFVPRYGLVFGPIAIVALLALCAAAESALDRAKPRAPAAQAAS
jgi:thiamine transporter ThiT